MRRGTVILLATALVFLLGCTEAGESTKVGAISGGAVGAGLGAVIGSQTGDAAGGLVIGGLAGAGAGAAVGNALDERDQAISSQDLALERQDKIIEAQKNQIDELRRLSQDSVRFKGDTSFDSRSADSRTPLGAPVVSRDISSRTLPTGSSLGQV
ncbi:MAG: hypothetical protein KDD64_00950, partial [Bdellovibrionales bacterium]|nr:hypothetical protein [Bdellovibrionales bacterium]